MSLTVSNDVAGNVKPSFASSSAVGLTVRANGEETIKVLDAAGNMVDAILPAPVAAPILSQTRTVTATTTNGSAALVITAGAMTANDVGKPVSGTSIPAGAKDRKSVV